LRILFDEHLTRDDHLLEAIVGAILDLKKALRPQIEISVHVQAEDMDDPKADLDEILHNNQIDFWILGRENIFKRPGMVFEAVYTDPFVLNISTNHPLYRPNLSIEDLPEIINNTTLYMLQNRACYVNEVLLSIAKDLTPYYQFSTSADEVCMYVALGMGVSIIPCRTDTAVRNSEIRSILLPNTSFYTLAGYSEENDNPLLPMLLHYLKKHIEAYEKDTENN
jgi:DNA-binding transcriptional LysR family regulator